MAGGRPKYRHLSRKSSHRKALLRNLLEAVIQHETIRTTFPKAKEAQRFVEKVITLGKKGTEASKRRAEQIFFRPHQFIPKVFGPLADRYRDRAGGYTRVLHIEPLKEDQAPSAILELVDGPKDMRFHLAAKSITYARLHDRPISEGTAKYIEKVCALREGGKAELDALARKLERFQPFSESDEFVLEGKRAVYGPTERPMDATWGRKGHRRHELEKIHESDDKDVRIQRLKEQQVWQRGWEAGNEWDVDKEEKEKK
ncbi:ribosomal protein L17 [Eremomyces bilateralis CBS 781.70]|uniref:Large ribosomal subunit protein bL17m n=1 Tax=Eremomyces bilateralis CBS 781.70 TaxID=1392243 RepID=A0A6G1FVU0_9PEZI|nr:ribosomal protein L17 [Eremomyces bilateralis CBS 781.70]KAF1809947.1 ribosomal protein L17 [Eremomyces bilateralis CBS 781.70]